MLLIDVGNSRIKWATVRNGLWLQQGHVAIDQVKCLAQQWQGLSPSQVVGCCVAGQAVMNELETLVQLSFALSIAWLRVTSTCCGVLNHYKNSGQNGEYDTTLGTDRWAALIAVHHRYSGHRVVVNVGTAMTVDALTAKGEFLGGMILPGIRLMQVALNTHTARLPYAAGQYDPFPKTTNDAIYTGILTALSSTIDTLAKRLIEYCGSLDVQCIISGGDAELVSPYLSYPYQVVDELVLQGLTIIAQNDAAVWQRPDKSVGRSVKTVR
jgi:type III pantothenate kinase